LEWGKENKCQSVLSEPLLQAISNSLHDMLISFDREISYNGTVRYLNIYHVSGSIKKKKNKVLLICPLQILALQV